MKMLSNFERIPTPHISTCFLYFLPLALPSSLLPCHYHAMLSLLPHLLPLVQPIFLCFPACTQIAINSRPQIHATCFAIKRCTNTAAATGIPQLLPLRSLLRSLSQAAGKPLVKPATARITLPTFVRAACFIYGVVAAAAAAATVGVVSFFAAF